MPKSPWWVWASLVAMTLASLASLAFRYRSEASNRAVAIIMEGQTVHDLAAASGRDIPHLLPELQEAGLSGVTLTEETVGDLIDRGAISVSPNTSFGVLITGGPGELARVAEAISRRGGMATNPAAQRLGSLNFDGDVRALRSSSVGIDPMDAAAVQGAHLLLVVRHSNVVGAGPAYIRDLLEGSKALGAVAYLASGDQVLGQRESIDDTALALTDLGMDYLTPEFVKISGDSKLSSAIPERTMRLHSMQQAEIDKSSPGSVVDRYTLAFRERNVRWLLVRPLSLGGPDAVQSTRQFLNALRSSLIHAKGGIKTPRPYTDPGVPHALFLVIGFLAVPWMFWTASQLVPGRLWTWLFGIGCLGIGVLSYSESLRPLCALAIGVAGPVTAYLLWTRSAESSKSVVFDLIKISAVSLSAGLAIAGLLNSLPYLIEVKQALGVKAVLIGPVFIVTWMLITWSGGFKAIGQQPVKWGPLLTGLVLIGAVAFLAVRSGNDAPSAVSDGEIKFRALLDQIFYTRPRTKEILIGHPALLLGLLLFRRSKTFEAHKAWAIVLLCVGAIGQADIVDTMCHTHTPLDIGLARIVLGLIVGGIIGALLWVPVRAWADRREGT